MPCAMATSHPMPRKAAPLVINPTPPTLPPRPPRSPKRPSLLKEGSSQTEAPELEIAKTSSRPISPLELNPAAPRLPPRSPSLTSVIESTLNECDSTPATNDNLVEITDSKHDFLAPPRHPTCTAFSTRGTRDSTTSRDQIALSVHSNVSEPDQLSPKSSSNSVSRHEPEIPQRIADQDETLTEFEDQEIDTFLRRASKQLQDVAVTQTTERPALVPVPGPSPFAVYEPHLLDVLHRYCPPSLLGPDERPSTSISQLRASLERCYVLAPPALWHALLQGNLGDLYRWTDPRQSTKFLLGYFLLWAFDLIPAFLVAYLLFAIIKRQTNPPPLSQLKREADQRRMLGIEAEKLGLSSGAASSMLSRSIGNNALIAGVPGIPQLIGPSALATEEKEVKDQIGIYSLGRGLYSHYGSPIQLFLTDFGELGEKIKNLYLWRKPEACWRSCVMLVMILVYFLLVPQKWVVKNFLGTIGIYFFFVLGFVERYPRFRKAFNPFYWILFEVPSDAEYALELLRVRAQKKGKAKGPEELKTSSPPKPRKSDGLAVGIFPESDRWRRWGNKVLQGSSETYRRMRGSQAFPKATEDHTRNRTGGTSKHCDLQDGETSVSTFAMLDGKSPGHLIIGSDQIRFEPMRGFRTKVMTSAKPLSGILSTTRSSLDSGDGGVIKPASSAISIEAKMITRLRKTQSFGLGVIGGDGLEFLLNNADVFLFDNISNRNDFFQLVLSMPALGDKAWASNY